MLVSELILESSHKISAKDDLWEVNESTLGGE